MNYLVFKVGTLGLPKRYDVPYTKIDNFPQIIELSYIIGNDAKIIEHKQILIKRNNISADTTRLLGITKEKSLRDGIDIEVALNQFCEAMKETSILVAHNFEFDYFILRAEFIRNNIKFDDSQHKKISTMEVGTEYCKLENLKWVKLEELYYKLFGKKIKKTFDTRKNCMRCYECLIQLKRELLPDEVIEDEVIEDEVDEENNFLNSL